MYNPTFLGHKYFHYGEGKWICPYCRKTLEINEECDIIDKGIDAEHCHEEKHCHPSCHNQDKRYRAEEWRKAREEKEKHEQNMR